MSLDVYLTAEVNTGGATPHEVTLFEYNITHNLGKMAREAGIYKAMWDPGGAFTPQAKDIIKPLEDGITLLELDPGRFDRWNATNGWGCREDLIRFAKAYLAACIAHPLARIRVSR